MVIFFLFWFSLPPGFPLPQIEPGNPVSEAKFELGRRLFYDRRLSWDGQRACGDCHQQSRAFSGDGRTMTLTNVAYNESFTWTNPRLRSLEQQAIVPMMKEMGVRGHERQIVQRLRADYEADFRHAFPGEPFSLKSIARAIAVFERRLISGRSPYDRAVYDAEHQALSPAAWRGMNLFFSKRATCSECHSGFNFSGPVRYVGGRSARRAPARVPTLRNVELTAPYLHDGSVATLDKVIERYAIAFTAQEKDDLLAFLRSLTDRAFVTDPQLAPRRAGVSPAASGRLARSP